MACTKSLSQNETSSLSQPSPERHYGDLRKALFLQRQAAYRKQTSAGTTIRDCYKIA